MVICRVGRHQVDLARGQLAFATRFLATKLKWSEARIRRFLKRLEGDAMVSIAATRESTRITICNYDKYAFNRRTGDAPIDAQNVTTSAHSRRKEEEHNNFNDDGDGDGDNAREGFDLEVIMLRNRMVELVRVKKKTPLYLEALPAAKSWLARGWKVDIIIPRMRLVMARADKFSKTPSSWNYFEGELEEAHQDGPR